MPSGLAVWVQAMRPRTLPLSVTPVVLGTGLAFLDTGRLDLPVFIAALATAILLQVGVNLHNDAADFRRGADAPGRLGPPRAVAQGWLDAARVERAALVAFALAVAAGLFLVIRGGWPFLILGGLAVAAGLAYTGGPRPLAYHALGELFVFLFFGPVAVAGSYVLQTGRFAPIAFAQGVALGALAAAVLVVNNYRDLESDRQAGKRTLAVRLGRVWTRQFYGFLVLVPMAVTLGLGLYLPLLLLPLALWIGSLLGRRPPGTWLNGLLARTALLQSAYALLVLLDLWLRRAAA